MHDLCGGSDIKLV